MGAWFSRQKQTASEGSTAVQAKGDVIINQGVSVSDVREIALDIFRANLLEYRGVAMEVAARRGEELTDNFLERIQKEHPAGLQQAQTPSFQDDLFAAQKEYAKAGEQDLGELLVDLLVDRSKESERSTLQIVLSESLRVAPKLTTAQTNTLSVVFLCRYVFNQSPTLAVLSEHLKKCLGPIADAYTTSRSAFNHLAFAGCGTVQVGEWSIRAGWTRLYSGLFQKGLEQPQIDAAGLPDQLKELYVGPCINDQTKLQVRILGAETLHQLAEKRVDVKQHQQALENLLNQGLMDMGVIQQKLDSLAPFMPKLFSDWESSELKSFNLTSVGIAIAHANIKRFAGEFAQLSIWIE